MQQFIRSKAKMLISALMLIIFLGFAGLLYFFHVNAGSDPAAAAAVTLKGIDYDNMQLTLDTGGNAIVYYSTNKSKWYEVDGAIGTNAQTQSNTLTYDISWLSESVTTTLYFKGNVKTKTLSVKIPGYNKNFKVTFDKTDGKFEFDRTDGAEVIRWRKSTDYNWRYVNAERSAASKGDGSTKDKPQSIEEFEKEVEALRVKGARLVFQIVPSAWKSASDPGFRASKDVKVTISAKRTAPMMKVNIKKLTVNTKTSEEWTTTNPFNNVNAVWKSCEESNMALADLAADAVNGTSDVTLYFRSEATSNNCESKVAALKVPARGEAPSSPVTINQTAGKSAGNGKAEVTFVNVPTEGYEYVIVKTGTLEDETKAAWKTIKVGKTVKFTEKTLPAGSIIYIRKAGVTENVSKGIELKLPSKYMSMTVGTYPTVSEAAAG